VELPAGAVWQSLQQSQLVANREEHGERDDEFSIRGIFVHTSKLFLRAVRTNVMRTDGFTSPPKEGALRILIALKIHRLGRV
jgi:hypothetical protein